MKAYGKIHRGVFELPFRSNDNTTFHKSLNKIHVNLHESLLVKNAYWFCNLRWVSIGLLLIFGLNGFFPVFFQLLGLTTDTQWAFLAAGILAAANIGYLINLNHMRRLKSYSSITLHLWFQIILDLCVITGVVHFIGSLETYVTFTYIFHIVLSCICFPGTQSLYVTIVACGFYLLCVILERGGFIPPAGIFTDNTFRNSIEHTGNTILINVISVLIIWLIVWYLVSHISTIVLEREYKLSESNKRMKINQVEKATHMLRTTHELKAPFAAIHANTQLLLQGFCGDMPEKAIDVLYRISTRCRRLTAEIQEMLQLANLRSVDTNTIPVEELDLAAVLEWCLLQVQPLAEQEKIKLEKDIKPVTVHGVEEHLKMLFVNLISNAIHYSDVKERVTVLCRQLTDDVAEVTIEDEGIGIPADKLHRIFEEYFRTDEAVRHNKASSGLGLTIVEHIVQTHKIRLRVESKEGLGTKFVLLFSTVLSRPKEGERAWPIY